MTGYGHLVTYIRQNILRYGMSSEKKMREVGITLSKEQIAAIKSKLDKISVSKEICAKNRYWDPFVLDSIYNNYSGSIPKTIYEKGIRNQLDRIISFLRDMPETNAMFCKYSSNVAVGNSFKNDLKSWNKALTFSIRSPPSSSFINAS